MGRGRAKAKQQKVARELKYNSHRTDFAALQRELSGGPAPGGRIVDDDDEGDTGPDEHDTWAEAR
jgi:Protein of unknown function (DUF3073)